MFSSSRAPAVLASSLRALSSLTSNQSISRPSSSRFLKDSSSRPKLTLVGKDNTLKRLDKSIEHSSATTPKRQAHYLLNRLIVDASNATELEHLILRTKTSDFNDVNCSTAFQQMAKFHSHHRLTLDKLFFMAATLEFQPRQLSTILHALAKLTPQNEIPAFLLDQYRNADFGFFDSTAMANSLYSLALLNHSSLCEKFSRELYQRPSYLLDEFHPQGLALVLWSFAKLNPHTDVAFVHKWTKEINQRQLEQFSMQTIVMILTSLKTLRCPSLEFCMQVAQYLKRERLGQFLSKDLVSIVECMADAGFSDDPACVTLLGEELMKRVKDLKTFDLSTLLHSMSLLHRDDIVFNEAVAQELLTRSPMDLSNTQLVHILTSLAQLRWNQPDLIRFVASEILAREQGELKRIIPGKELIELLWSFVCLNVCHVDEVKAIFAMSPTTRIVEESADLCAQLLQIELSFQPEDVPQLVKSLLEQPWIPEAQAFLTNTPASPTCLFLRKTLMLDSDQKIWGLVHNIKVQSFVPQLNAVVELDHGRLVFSKQVSGDMAFRHRLLLDKGVDIVLLPTTALVDSSLPQITALKERKL